MPHSQLKANAPRDGLADLSRADHDDYLCHSGEFLTVQRVSMAARYSA